MTPISRHVGRTLVATLLAVGPWTTAHAGIGGLVKGAKDKATQAATGQKPAAGGMTPRQVKFDDTMVELTAPLLDKLLAARTKANAGLKERPALVQRQTAIKTEVDDLGGKYGNAIWETDNKIAEHRNCMGMELDAIRQKKYEEMQKQMMANPASSKKLLELTAAMNDAQIKGDTAAVRRLGREAEQIFAPTRADTLAALQKCGAAPQPHPAGVKIGTLNAELAKVDAKIRDMDQKAMRQQAEDCKLPEASVAMGWERIESFCGGQGAFSEKELAALNERKGALCAALKG